MSSRSIAIAALAAAALSLTITGCSHSGAVKAAAKPEKDRKLAPDFTLKDSTGSTLKLSDYHGKVVLLNFWATWCGPCQIEIPWFIDFQKQYKDKDFAVLGVSFDDDGWKSVKPFIEQRKMNYRVAIGNDEVSNLYGGLDSLPTTFIIDRDGRIAAMHVGLVSKSDYQNDILNVLNQKEGISVEKRAHNDSGPVLLRPVRAEQ